MAYSMEEGKKLVVEAGLKLVRSGLIARTWGNVSARVSDNEFVITPSGIPYEKLTPDDIVPVKIDDCSYDKEGLKPSSEKGVHAAAYQLHPEVDFVIHTHQMDASVVGITGEDLPVPPEFRSLMGEKVPAAKYGLSSTETLRKNVYNAMKSNPSSYAVFMIHHGALCLGKDEAEAFEVASTLEKICGAKIDYACNGKDLISAYLDKNVDAADRESKPMDFGRSERNGDVFTLTMKDGSSYKCGVLSGAALIGEGIAPRVSRLHAAIYRSSDVSFIRHDTNPYVVALSRSGKTEIPYLDDFAQISGIDVKNESYEESEMRTQDKVIAKTLKSRNAVFIKGQGALCTGSTDSDTEAVELVLEKEAHAALYAGLVDNASTLMFAGVALERTVYVAKYSKLASKK